jgi:hypothetical protein
VVGLKPWAKPVQTDPGLKLKLGCICRLPWRSTPWRNFKPLSGMGISNKDRVLASPSTFLCVCLLTL